MGSFATDALTYKESTDMITKSTATHVVSNILSFPAAEICAYCTTSTYVHAIRTSDSAEFTV
jgi:hypothetical protein